MSFKSIIQDMKDEMGSISRKGFDVRLLRCRSSSSAASSSSNRVVMTSSSRMVVAPLTDDDEVIGGGGDEGLKRSWWSSMPPELLRDVLMRIEESESSWPPRKDVVSCAGVCRSWREIMKEEIVKIPELSGKITFPISLKQPGPRDFPLQCFIKRNRTTHTYNLYLGLTSGLTDDGKFLLAARKCRRATCTDYHISLDANDMSKGSGTYIGKLRSNFLGTKFTVYDAQPPHVGAMIAQSRSTRLVSSKQVSPRVPAGNYPVAHISYELNVLGSRGPRRMQCVMDSIPASAVEPGGSAPTPAEFLINSLDSFSSVSFFRSKSSHIENRSDSFSVKEGRLVLKNKSPRWL